MDSTTRPARYPMCLPVLYRADGESLWHEGVTVNLSADGALIDGDPPSPHAGTVVVVIPLLTSEGCLIGRGRIMREPAADAPRQRFAIAVAQYRLERQSAALAHLDTLHQEC